MKERVSTPEDFPNLAVYRDGGAWTIAFKNLEFEASKWVLTRNLVLWVGAMVGSVFAAMWLADRMALPWYVWIGGIAAISIGGFWMIRQPRFHRRVIELDFAGNELRVYRDGKLQGRRPLSSMESLTVDEHPEAEAARIRRQDRKESKVSDFERQHTLYGFFGVKGAETVPLVHRAEYPPKNTLREVQRALFWTIETASQGSATLTPTPSTTAPLQPPLD